MKSIFKSFIKRIAIFAIMVVALPLTIGGVIFATQNNNPLDKMATPTSVQKQTHQSLEISGIDRTATSWSNLRTAIQSSSVPKDGTPYVVAIDFDYTYNAASSGLSISVNANTNIILVATGQDRTITYVSASTNNGVRSRNFFTIRPGARLTIGADSCTDGTTIYDLNFTRTDDYPEVGGFVPFYTSGSYSWNTGDYTYGYLTLGTHCRVYNMKNFQTNSSTVQRRGAVASSSTGSVTIDGAELYNNYSYYGVIYNYSGEVNVFSGSIRDNKNYFIDTANGVSLTNTGSASTAGIYSNGGTINITGGEFVNNDALNRGGAIFSAGATDIYLSGDVSFVGNCSSEQNHGGAIYLSTANEYLQIGSAEASATDVLFKDNYTVVSGGAIYSNGAPMEIYGGKFYGNHAVTGGAIYTTSTLTLKDATFGAEPDGATSRANYATDDGGAVYSTNSIEIINSVFDNNYATTGEGGAVKSTKTVGIDGATFTNNTAKTNGGALVADGGIDMTNAEGGVTFSGNNTDANGGAISCGAVVITQSSNDPQHQMTFDNNSAASGGAIFGSSTVDVEGPVFSNNTATDNAGAIYSSSTTEISNATFEANTSGKNGGAIYSIGSTIINSGTFGGDVATEGNIAAGNGGAVFVAGAQNSSTTLTVYGGTFGYNVSNTNDGGGGALCNYGPVTISGGNFLNNSAPNGNSETDGGGAVYTRSESTISGGAFSGNSAYYGGAIFAGVGEPITINGPAVFTQNTANRGGVLYSNNIINISNGTFGGSVAGNENTATNAGQAIYLTSTSYLNISGAAKIYDGIYIPGSSATAAILVSVTSSLTTDGVVTPLEVDNYTHIARKLVVRGTGVASLSGKFKMADNTTPAVEVVRTSSTHIEIGGDYTQTISNVFRGEGQTTPTVTTETETWSYGDTYSQYVNLRKYSRQGYTLTGFERGNALYTSEVAETFYSINLNEQVWYMPNVYGVWQLSDPIVEVNSANTTYTPTGTGEGDVTLTATVTNNDTVDHLIDYTFAWYLTVNSTPIATGVSSEGNVSTLTIDITTFPNAGIYNYYAVVYAATEGTSLGARAANATTDDVTSDNAVVTVAKRQVSFTLTNNTFTYSGSPISAFDGLTGNGFGNLVFKTFNATTGLDVVVTANSGLEDDEITDHIANPTGSSYTNSCMYESVANYILSFNFDATSNYILTSSNANWQITQKYVTLQLNNSSLTYNGTAQSILGAASAGNYANVTSAILSGDTQSSVLFANHEQTNFGNYVLSFSSVLTDGVNRTNYILTNSTLNWQIAKLQVTFAENWLTEDDLVYSATSFEYDGTAHTITIGITNRCASQTSADVYATYTLMGTTTNTATNAGNYTATVNGLAGTTAANYQLPSDLPTTAWAIAKSGVIANWGTSSFVYDGTAKTITVANFTSENDSDVVIAVPAENIIYTNNAVYTNSQTYYYAEGYTAQVVISTTNYEVTQNATKNWTIEQRTVDVNWSEQVEYEYNKQTYSIKADSLGNIATADLGAGIVGVYTYSSENRITVGNYATTITGLTGTRSENYKLPSSGKVFAWTIVPRQLAINYWANETNGIYSNAYNYNGYAHSVHPVFTNVLSGDSVTLIYKNEGNDRQTASNAGVYSAVIDSLENPNYTAPAVNSFEWEIKAISITINWGVNFSYDGTIKTMEATYTGFLTGNVAIGYDNTSGFSNSETSAGEYTAKAVLIGTDAGNYIIANAEHDWKIAKATGLTVAWYITEEEGSAPELYADAFTYNAKEQGVFAIISGTQNGETVEVSEYAENAAINAGNYSASIVTLNSNNYAVPTSVKAWEISKKAVSIEWPTASTFTYDGTQKEYAPSVAEGVIQTNALGEADEFTLVVEGPTAATAVGNYDLEVTGISGNDNYEIPVTATVEGSWNITTAALTVQWFTNEELTTAYATAFDYRGGGTYSTVYAKVTGLVSSEEDLYQVSGNSEANAGQHTATLTLDASIINNYTITSNTLVWNIAKRTVAVSWTGLTADNAIYSGTNKTVTASVTNNIEDFGHEISLVLENNSKKFVGNYQAEVVGVSGEYASNYQLPTDGSEKFEWSITPYTLEINNWYIDETNAVYNATSFIYDNTQKSITAKFKTVYGADVVSAKYSNNAKINAGDYTAEIVGLTGANASNYQLSEVAADLQKSWTISRAVLTANWAVGNYIYTGSAQGPSFDGATGTVYDATVDYQVSGNEQTDASPTPYTAQVLITGDGKDNYRWSNATESNPLESIVSYTILPYVLTSLTWEPSEFTFDGDLHSVEVASAVGVDGEITTLEFTYEGNGQRNVQEGGHVVTATGITNNTNYTIDEYTENLSTTLTITPKGLQFGWTIPVLTYDGSPKSITALPNAGIVMGEDDVQFEFSQINSNTQTNAGTYTAEIVGLTGANASNYTLNGAITPLTQTFSITPKAIDITWNYLDEGYYSITYNKLVHSMTASVSSTDIGSDVVNISYINDATNTSSATVVGKYTAKAESENSNYTFNNETQVWSIVAKEITPVASTHVYNATEQQLTVSLPGIEHGDTVTALYGGSETAPTQTNAGTSASYTISLSGADSDNYQLAQTLFSWTIAEAELFVSNNYTAPYTYNGAEQTPAFDIIGLQGDDTAAFAYVGTPIDTGNYTVTVSFMRDGVDVAANYNITDSLTVAFSIVKATPTVEIVNLTSLVHGTEVNYFAVIVTGMEGNRPFGDVSVSLTYNGSTAEIPFGGDNQIALKTVYDYASGVKIYEYTLNDYSTGAPQTSKALEDTAADDEVQAYLSDDSVSIAVFGLVTVGNNYSLSANYIQNDDNYNNASTATAFEAQPTNSAQAALNVYDADGAAVTAINATYGDTITLYVSGGEDSITAGYGLKYGNTLLTTSGQAVISDLFYMVISDHSTNPIKTLGVNQKEYMIELVTLRALSGSVLLSAYKPGDGSNYAPVQSSSFTVTVAKKTITAVTINNASKTFNDDDPDLSINTIAGLVEKTVGDYAEIAGLTSDLDNVTSSFVLTRTNNENAGVYADSITVADFDNANYVLGEGAVTAGTFTINALAFTQGDLTITITNPNHLIYTGQSITPAVSVMHGETQLIGGTADSGDYYITIPVDGNKTAGTNAGTVFVNLRGNYKNGAAGTAIISQQFNILQATNFTFATIVSKVYTGAEIIIEESDYEDLIVMFGETPLVAGTDYDIVTDGYSNNTNVTTMAVVKITAKGNFSGTKTAFFAITAKELSTTVRFVVAENPVYANGAPIVPSSYTVYDGDDIISSTNYTVTFSDNNNAGTEAKANIIFKNNYANASDYSPITINYTIERLRIENCDDITLTYTLTSNVYTGEAITFASYTLKHGSKVLVKDVDFEEYNVANDENYYNNTNASTESTSAEWRFILINNYSNDGIYLKKEFNIAPRSFATNSGFGIDEITAEKIFNGKLQTLDTATELFVRYNGELLDVEDDFSVNCSNNVNAGTATVTVTGHGNFTGSMSAQYTISQRQFKVAEFSITGEDESLTYTGIALTLTNLHFQYQLKENGELVYFENLTQYDDYALLYRNNVNATTSASKAEVEITFAGGNFVGSHTIEFGIRKKSMSEYPGDFDIQIAGLSEDKIYTSEGIVFNSEDIVVNYNNGYEVVTLTEGEDEDYIVVYKNNINVGTARVIIRGRGNFERTYYVFEEPTYGEIVKTFRIVPAVLTDSMIADIANQTYNTQAQSPTLTIAFSSETDLTEGTDFSVAYANNINKGTAVATVTGLGNFAGSTAVKNFTIDPFDIDSSAVTIEIVEEGITFDGTQKKPAVKVTFDNEVVTYTMVLGATKDFTVAYGENIHAGETSGTITLTGVNNFTGSKGTKFAIAALTVSNANLVTISPINNYYTGVEVTPSFDVNYDGVDLAEAENYNVEFSFGTWANNVNICAYNAVENAPSVQVTFAGDLVGTVTKTFSITARPFDYTTDGGLVTIDHSDSVYYTGTSRLLDDLVLTYTYGTEFESELTNADYAATYSNNVELGEATISIVFMGRFSGSTTTTFTISKADIQQADLTSGKLVVTGITDDKSYTGSEVKFSNIIVTYDGTVMYSNDYEVIYANAIEAATKDDTLAPTVTIAFGGELERFTGSVSIKYTINSKTLAGNYSEFTYVVNNATLVFNGTAQTNTITATYLTTGDVLTEGTDYEISYSGDTTNVGMVTINVTGLGNFTGTFENACHFNIDKLDISTIEEEDLSIEEISAYVYSGQANTPTPDVTFNSDYAVTYSATYLNNINKGNATLTINGTGNYKGSIDVQFVINAKELVSQNLTLTATGDLTYTGSAVTPTAYTLKFGSVTLNKDVDFEEYDVENGGNYFNNINASEQAELRFRLINNYSNAGTYLTRYFTISPRNISFATIAPIDDVVYNNGNAVVPTLDITYNEMDLVIATDYTVNATNNINAGVANISVAGTGNYTGSTSTTFTIIKATYGAASYSGELIVTYDNADMTLADVQIPSTQSAFRWADPSTRIISDGGFTEGGTVKAFAAIYNANPNGYEDFPVQIQVRLLKANYEIEDITNPIIFVNYVKNMHLSDVVITDVYITRITNLTLAGRQHYTWLSDINTPINSVTAEGSPLTTFKMSYNANPNFYNTIDNVACTITVEKGTYTASQAGINPDSTYLTVLQTIYNVEKTLANITLPANYYWEDSTTLVGDVVVEGASIGTKQFTGYFNDDPDNFNNKTVKFNVKVTRASFEVVDSEVAGTYDRAHGYFALPTGLTTNYSATGVIGSVTLPAEFAWLQPTVKPTLAVSQYLATFNAGSVEYPNFLPYGTEGGLNIEVSVLPPALSLALAEGATLPVWNFNTYLRAVAITTDDVTVEVTATGEEVLLSSIAWKDAYIKPENTDDQTVTVVVVVSDINFVGGNGKFEGTVMLHVSKQSFILSNITIDGEVINLFANEMGEGKLQYLESIKTFGEDFSSIDLNDPNIETDDATRELKEALVQFRSDIIYTYQIGSLEGSVFTPDAGIEPEEFNPSSDALSITEAGKVYRITATFTEGKTKNYEIKNTSDSSVITTIDKFVEIGKAAYTVTVSDYIQNYGDAAVGISNINCNALDPSSNIETTGVQVYKMNKNAASFSTYFSEDGVLLSEVDSVTVEGLQSAGIIGNQPTTLNTSTGVGLYLLVVLCEENPNFDFSYRFGTFNIEPVVLTPTFKLEGGGTKIIETGGDLKNKFSATVNGFLSTEERNNAKITYVFTKNGQVVNEVVTPGVYKVQLVVSDPNYIVNDVFEFEIEENLAGASVILIVIIIVAAVLVLSAVTLIIIKSKQKAATAIKANQASVGRMEHQDMIKKLRQGENVDAFGKEVSKADVKKELEIQKERDKASKIDKNKDKHFH